MLQQTQVNTVIPYFLRFMQHFPAVEVLAAAPLDRVLEQWSGLGYYARARNLHRAARYIVDEYQGDLPCEQALLESLPGIGRSTAGAIRALACGQHAVILDGNVKRVLARYHAISGWPGLAAVGSALWQLAETHTPKQRVADYTQAMMDLGAMICTRGNPNCVQCPLARGCKAKRQDNPKAYPGSKPRRERPQKATRMLLLRNGCGELLLQKRPATGIWGGLWSFPEIGENEDLSVWLQQRFALVAAEVAHWPAVDHQFTHFRLTILPALIQVAESADSVMEMAPGTMLWYNTAHPAPGGFPAPVAKLLQQYRAAAIGTTGADNDTHG